ncbi:MAG: CinA family nicotinamide mononucleotide deamidase-related protein [Dehalococcoidales bacterium]|nr:CinA family nicotinamide mononucleotide deamidase-related protein [Dehalococcoidales bacterium]
MKAEIIATGTELLLGEIVDTNTQFIADQLAILGFDHYYSTIVGDNYERLLGVLRQAWGRSDIIILTGGLGPTSGDITRDVIAGLLGETPTVIDSLKRDLTDYFARMGREMPDNNLKQATLIPSAKSIPNRRGTAPGWWVEKDGRIIMALPGPPGELQPMWQEEVLPGLEKKTNAVILSRILKTSGLSEGKVDEMVRPFMAMANPTLAIYAKPDGIHLRITAKATNRETAGSMIAEREATLRGILRETVWGTDSDTMESAVGRLLKSKGLTLAIAESFTGGYLTNLFAGAPDSHDFFRGGIVAVAADVAKSLLNPGLSGEASAETAVNMAGSVRAKFGADIGVGVTGFLQPEPGTAFIAIADGKREATTLVSKARSNQLVRRTTQQTLFGLRSLLLDL